MNNKKGQEDIVAKRLQQNVVRSGLNAVSNETYENIRKAPIVENAAQKMEDAAANKLNNITSKTPLNKPINDINKKINTPKSMNNANKSLESVLKKNNNASDIANQKLKNTNNNRGRRIFNYLKKRNNIINSEGQSTDEEIDDSSTEIDDVIAHARRMKIIISVLSIAVPIFLIIIVFALVIVILGSTIFKPILSFMGYNDNKINTDYYMINDVKSKDYTEEMNYYKKLEDIGKDYQKKCNVNLNTNYIHASLIYLYYQVDYSDEMMQSKIYIDYNKMTSMIDKVYSLMVKDGNKEIKCDVDYDIDGDFYHRLLTDFEFRNYYEDLLKEEDMTDILDNIFDLASSIDFEYDDSTNVFISPKLKVNYNGLNINAKDYLTGVIYNNLDKKDLSNKELLKAYAIYYTTNTIYNGDFSSDKLSISVTGADYCDINSNCNGKGRITELEKSNIRNSIDNVYGNVLLNNNGGFVYLNNTLQGGNDYKKMLSNTYPNYQIKNLLENTYDAGTNYGSNKILTKVYFYDQNDYSNVAFCGRKKATIKSSGCGVTAMAMIVSTYENSSKYDPVYEMNRAYKWGYCGQGISGTGVGFFKKEAKQMGYKYLKVGKSKTSDLNLVLSHLSKGDLVIAHMGPGHFTSGGHYMVLGGVDPDTRKVYVYDPYNKSNKANKKRKTGNGWYSLNDMIAKEAFAFYIIWKG